MSKSDFRRYLSVMKRRDPQLQEGAFRFLQEHAHMYVDDLIDAFGVEGDPGLRSWLVELISDARSVSAFGFLVDCLRSDEEMLWSWAIRGLAALGTKEARQVLRSASSYNKSTTEKTEYFRELLRQEANFVPNARPQGREGVSET